MTLSEIELDIYRRLDYADTPPVSVKNRIDGFINQRHRQLLASDRMRLLRIGATTFTTVPNRAGYGLPGGISGCARIQRIVDPANQIVLIARTAEWYRDAAPDPSTQASTPAYWIPMGFSPVAVRPLSLGQLWIASIDKPPGNMTYELVLVGVANGQDAQVITVAPTLSTPDPLVRKAVTLPAGFIVTDIASFTSSLPVQGSVAIFDAAAAGNIITQITIGEGVARYYRFVLYPMPSAAITYLVDYEREIPALNDPNDEPLLPADFHDLIALWARLDEYEFKSDDRWMATRSLVEQRVMELRQWVDNHDIHRQHAIPTGDPRPSRLGAWFPAGT